MARVLIVYGTTEGHTATIAARIREAIEARGHEVAVERARVPPSAIADTVDGVVVGASVHRTQYDFFTRLLLRLIVRGHTTPEERDTSHDVDYTDYEAVRRFAESFVDRLEAG